jgi:hypothetical protein
MLASYRHEKDFVELVQLCKDGLAVFDLDLRYILVNKRMAQSTESLLRSIKGGQSGKLISTSHWH